MANKTPDSSPSDTDPFAAMLEAQARWTEMMFAPLAEAPGEGKEPAASAMADLQKWAENTTRMQSMWIEFCQNHALEATSDGAAELSGGSKKFRVAAGETPDPANAAPSDTQHLGLPGGAAGAMDKNQHKRARGMQEAGG